MVDQLICVGVISQAHGIRGQVKIKSFTESPSDIGQYGVLWDQQQQRQFQIKLAGAKQAATTDSLIATITGISDRNQAEALKGTKLYIERARLPEAPDEDEFYHADLIGLAVHDLQGAQIGQVKAIFDFGSGDVIELAWQEGGYDYFPFTKAVFPEVNLTEGWVSFIAPETIGDEEETNDSATADNDTTN